MGALLSFMLAHRSEPSRRRGIIARWFKNLKKVLSIRNRRQPADTTKARFAFCSVIWLRSNLISGFCMCRSTKTRNAGTGCILSYMVLASTAMLSTLTGSINDFI
ncbi:hypothetical protein H2248_003132 [Termitomyces sp. 'cryptogamus']|nr:hypothetical protein H2248_003132 [Termitomyces sp. 'cryptogamus']